MSQPFLRDYECWQAAGVFGLRLRLKLAARFGSHHPAPCETGATFVENAMLKAVYYSKHCTELLFAEDSGLEVDALDGAPGVYSARFAGETATDEQNNRLLLARMDGIAGRRARFVSTIALARAGQVIETFTGVVEGEILTAPRGTNGFGYDPLFYYPPFGCSFGEATLEQKMSVSHRSQAALAMKAAIFSTASIRLS